MPFSNGNTREHLELHNAISQRKYERSQFRGKSLGKDTVFLEQNYHYKVSYQMLISINEKDQTLQKNW
jgi:hypothetical protein